MVVDTAVSLTALDADDGVEVSLSDELNAVVRVAEVVELVVGTVDVGLVVGVEVGLVVGGVEVGAVVGVVEVSVVLVGEVVGWVDVVAGVVVDVGLVVAASPVPRICRLPLLASTVDEIDRTSNTSNSKNERLGIDFILYEI